MQSPRRRISDAVAVLLNEAARREVIADENAARGIRAFDHRME